MKKEPLVSSHCGIGRIFLHFSMHFRRISSKWKLIFIAFLLIWIVSKMFRSSTRCSTIYSSKSLEICANSSPIRCNFSQLIRTYFDYRSCILTNSMNNVDVVVFESVNGLGNRLLGLISVTMYALITGRILLIDWQPGDDHPTSFNDLFVSLDNFSTNSFSRYSFSRSIHLIRHRWINEIQHRFDSPLPRDWSLYFDRDLLCDNDDDFYRFYEHFGLKILRSMSNRIHWIRTDQYFLPLLIRNVRTRNSLMKLVPNGQFFSQIATQILHPVRNVQQLIDEFQRKSFSDQNDFPTIGVHMRSWSSFITDQIEPFEKCIDFLIKNFTHSKKIGLFVISNTNERREKLEKRILGKYSNVVRLVTSKENSMENTLADLLILSKMKHLILTSKSTFGMIAQGLAGRGAWIVWQGAPNEEQQRRQNPNVLCQFESSSEPEYQMMGKFHPNDSCLRTKFIGERTIL